MKKPRGWDPWSAGLRCAAPLPYNITSPYSFTFILFSFYFFLFFQSFSNSVSLFLLVQTPGISVFSSYFYPPGFAPEWTPNEPQTDRHGGHGTGVLPS